MILGIGLSKTGTKSLNEALIILGYNAIHLPSEAQLFSGKYDAFTDIPTIAFFDQLIKIYPDATIINTNRDYGSWIVSATKHFRSNSRSKYINYIRGVVFGSQIPTKWDLKEAYIRHQKMLDSLPRYLNLDISHENKWALLAGYLNKQIPKISYPHIR